MQPVATIPWVLLGLALAVFAPRIRTAIVGAPLLLVGAAVFAVRLHHAGPYPVPGPVDFVSGCLALLLGTLLIRSPWSRAGDGRTSPVTRVLLGLSPLVFLLALVAYGHEAEEVVVLRTTGPEGTIRETRLWIVDHQGSPWIVTGRGSGHDQDLQAHPRVEMFRAGETRCWVAERHLDRQTLETVLEVRSQTYLAQRLALASGVWRHFSERDDLEAIAVALRFTPCPTG